MYKLLIPLLLLCSCSSARKTTTQSMVTHTVETVTDTIYIRLPRQTAEATTADSLSVLNTDFATSVARLAPDGTLHHSLRTLDTPVEVPVPRVIEHTDSVSVITETESPNYTSGGPSAMTSIILILILCLAIRIFNK